MGWQQELHNNNLNAEAAPAAAAIQSGSEKLDANSAPSVTQGVPVTCTRCLSSSRNRQQGSCLAPVSPVVGRADAAENSSTASVTVPAAAAFFHRSCIFLQSHALCAASDAGGGGALPAAASARAAAAPFSAWVCRMSCSRSWMKNCVSSARFYPGQSKVSDHIPLTWNPSFRVLQTKTLRTWVCDPKDRAAPPDLVVVPRERESVPDV